MFLFDEGKLYTLSRRSSKHMLKNLCLCFADSFSNLKRAKNGLM